MKRMTKWKKAVSVLLIVATMALMVSGCGGKTATTENKGSSKYRVYMITDAGDITDQSFNQTTYEACRDYCAANDIDFTFKFIVLDMSASDIGAAAGALKAYLNVNEVIACIMLNWISLYAVNTALTAVKESSTTYTLPLRTNNPKAVIPHLGLQHLFADNRYVTIAIPLAVIFSSFFIQHITSGGAYVDKVVYCSQI